MKKAKKVVRYIGSKEKILPFLDEYMLMQYSHRFDDSSFVFVDGFAGTGIVSQYVRAKTKWTIVGADISKYSEVLQTPLVHSFTLDVADYLKQLGELDGEDGAVFNELSEEGKPASVTDYSLFTGQTHNSRLFFSKKTGRKIDAIKGRLKEETNSSYLAYGLYFLLAYADKNANNTSVYGAYLKGVNTKDYPYYNEELVDHLLNNDLSKKDNTRFIQKPIGDSLDLITNADLIYLDPPYNTRRYESNYHVLNYIVDLNFSQKDIKINSKTAVSRDMPTNPFGNKRDTENAFKDMIIKGISTGADVFISYNNEGTLSRDDLSRLCEMTLGLDLKTVTTDYKKFKSASNVDKKTVEEILWKISKKVEK